MVALHPSREGEREGRSSRGEVRWWPCHQGGREGRSSSRRRPLRDCIILSGYDMAKNRFESPNIPRLFPLLERAWEQG